MRRCLHLQRWPQLGPNTVTFRGTLARTSLRLSVVPGLSPLERYAWVSDALHTLPGSGIIYVLTVAEADRLALRDRAVWRDQRVNFLSAWDAEFHPYEVAG